MTILNVSALDYGGAGKFSVDFNDSLLRLGHKSSLIVLDQKTSSQNVLRYPASLLSKPFAKLARWVAKVKWTTATFDYNYYFYNVHERYTTISAKKILGLIDGVPDVIFIHWVTGFINARVIGDLYQLTNAKIYWLMIDNAPITGGCHYPWSCEGYKHDCVNCPAILSPADKWLAKENLRLKVSYLPANTGVIAFSASDYDRVKQSRLFRNNPINRMLGFVDEDKFQPGNKEEAKAYFGLSDTHRVVFFGASSLKEKRKGMQLLLNAMDYLQVEQVTFLIAGDFAPSFQDKNIRLIGYVNEDDLIKAYQASDLFVCPSLEDSGPLMVNQSIMCGTPVVAFRVGVSLDLVHTGRTGYSARTGDDKDLANGITELLRLNETDYLKMRDSCRNMAVSLYGKLAFQRQIDKLLEEPVFENL